MNFGINTVFCILAFCINVIAAAAYFFDFHGNQKVHSGYAPDGGHKKEDDGWKW